MIQLGDTLGKGSIYMESTAAKGESLSRLPELDGIRGIAISLVLVWHFVPTLGQDQSSPLLTHILKIAGFSWSGVDLFFVLSGFLIGGILLDHKESANYFSVFYFRRICRIFPLYFAWLFIFVILLSWFHMTGSASQFSWIFANPMPIWSYATFTQNFLMAGNGFFGSHFIGPTWSLAIEEQFYLILPFMIRFLPPRRLLPTLIILIVAAPLVRLASIDISNTGFPAYILLPCRADALLLGVLCAYLKRREPISKYIASHVWQLYIGFAILLLPIMGLAIRGQSIGSFHMTFYGFSLLALLYSCFLLIAITEKRGIVSLFTKNYFFGKLGLLAYGIYMFHQGVYGLSHALLLKQTPQAQTQLDGFVTLFALVVTLLLAYVSWFRFEKPFVLIGHSATYEQ